MSFKNAARKTSRGVENRMRIRVIQRKTIFFTYSRVPNKRGGGVENNRGVGHGSI